MSKGAETVGEQEIINAPVPVNDDKIDALIAAADKVDALGKALDKFRTFVLQRALPGDWVAFKEMGSDEEVLELTGAATDRIAAALGVSFVDWEDYKESGTDEKGQYFVWWYECTTLWQGRRIERTTGRAGSRDPFFGMVQGQLKALTDVKEGDVRTAARRNCMKEGVKLMLGLRRIPKSAAAGLGLDVSKVKTVSFGGGKSGNTGAAPAAQGQVVTLVKYETKEVPYKDKSRGTFTKWLFTDNHGAIYETIKEKFAHEVIEFIEKKTPVVLAYNKSQYGNDLQGVKAAPQGAPAEGAKTEQPAGAA